VEFIVREMASKPDTIYVRYDCACGCNRVEHQRQRRD
jgi:hypothetical protein